MVKESFVLFEGEDHLVAGRGEATDAVLFLHPARAVLNGKRAEAWHLYGVSGVQLILDHVGECLDDFFGRWGFHNERWETNEWGDSRSPSKNMFVGRNIKICGLRPPGLDASVRGSPPETQAHRESGDGLRIVLPQGWGIR